MLDNIFFEYVESDNQDDTFTKHHTRFDCMIEYNDNVFEFPYQCNTQYTEPTKESVLECLINDANAYDLCDNVYDFAKEFGYIINYEEDVLEVEEIYNSCKATYDALHKMFTDDELDMLFEHLFG